MEIGTIKVYKSQAYITITEIEKYSCVGCAFDNNRVECSNFIDHTSTVCMGGSCIWVPYVETPTAQQIIGAIKFAYPDAPEFDVQRIEQIVKQMNDPKYAEYLKLKEIFES